MTDLLTRVLSPVHRLLGRRHQAGAVAGDTVEQFNLGLSLDRAGDREGAERWYRAAAEAGDSDAANNLGLLLDGDANRKPEALPWFAQAAEAGDAEAAWNAAVLCEELGDSVAALNWYRTAASRGDRHAIRELERRNEL
ncbi:hypothetical protein BDK92_7098 [Micromonospora pisi]|uniref:Sel1 repeat family protein n=1 Tax=Micromonospora pisi TaxID=589240 RepID=A0A495JWC4_9ACTN|nr:sel1 repeat family protein [Micromonospora pisi]RKR92652.1 hypothetical protein BDK92_7098 [Micromonospora pisi]